METIVDQNNLMTAQMNGVRQSLNSYNDLKMYHERFVKGNTSLFYEGQVTRLTPELLQADVFVPSINVELKNIAICQSFVSNKNGTLNLVSAGSLVIVMLSAQIRPCIVFTFADKYKEMPPIKEGETISFTDESLTKQDVVGNIINENLLCVKSLRSDGKEFDYAVKNKELNNQHISISSRTKGGSAITYEKHRFDKKTIVGDVISRLQEKTIKLIKLRDKLNMLDILVEDNFTNATELRSCIYDIRQLLYNEYKEKNESYILTQKGSVVRDDKVINSIPDLEKVEDIDLKVSPQGLPLIYETQIVDNKKVVASISVDNKGNITLNCNNLVVNQRKE